MVYPIETRFEITEPVKTKSEAVNLKVEHCSVLLFHRLKPCAYRKAVPLFSGIVFICFNIQQ
jgi:hypothetical protein